MPKVVLSCLLKLIIKKFNHAVFYLKAPKAVIKGVFSRCYCYYGNLLYHKNDNKVFINHWTAFFDAMIVASIDMEAHSKLADRMNKSCTKHYNPIVSTI